MMLVVVVEEEQKEVCSAVPLMIEEVFEGLDQRYYLVDALYDAHMASLGYSVNLEANRVCDVICEDVTLITSRIFAFFTITLKYKIRGCRKLFRGPRSWD